MEKITAEMFEQIFQDIITNTNDYADKNKVKKHNAAHNKISKLLKDVESDKKYLTQLFKALLQSNNDKIKLSVATKCLEFDVLTPEAIECLNKLYLLNTLPGLDKLSIELTLKKYNKD
ncbi:MAG: hypothetical protein IJE91_01405 [Clostridia bacterium]|nr:hypothetical protein [Clostridia bacterium]